jgi:hypothetical protein
VDGLTDLLDPGLLRELWVFLHGLTVQLVPDPWATWLLASVPVGLIAALWLHLVVIPWRQSGRRT